MFYICMSMLFLYVVSEYTSSICFVCAYTCFVCEYMDAIF